MPFAKKNPAEQGARGGVPKGTPAATLGSLANIIRGWWQLSPLEAKKGEAAQCLPERPPLRLR